MLVGSYLLSVSVSVSASDAVATNLLPFRGHLAQLDDQADAQAGHRDEHGDHDGRGHAGALGVVLLLGWKEIKCTENVLLSIFSFGKTGKETCHGIRLTFRDD